jgi:hypothetical protein
MPSYVSERLAGLTDQYSYIVLPGPTTPFATVENGKFKHVGYTVSSSDG